VFAEVVAADVGGRQLLPVAVEAPALGVDDDVGAVRVVGVDARAGAVGDIR
jgi:hypothetical protein